MAFGVGDPRFQDPRAAGAVSVPFGSPGPFTGFVDSSWMPAAAPGVAAHDTFGQNILRNDWVPSWRGGVGISGSGDDVLWRTNNPTYPVGPSAAAPVQPYVPSGSGVLPAQVAALLSGVGGLSKGGSAAELLAVLSSPVAQAEKLVPEDQLAALRRALQRAEFVVPS